MKNGRNYLLMPDQEIIRSQSKSFFLFNSHNEMATFFPFAEMPELQNDVHINIKKLNSKLENENRFPSQIENVRSQLEDEPFNALQEDDKTLKNTPSNQSIEKPSLSFSSTFELNVDGTIKSPQVDSNNPYQTQDLFSPSRSPKKPMIIVTSLDSQLNTMSKEIDYAEIRPKAFSYRDYNTSIFKDPPNSILKSIEITKAQIKHPELLRDERPDWLPYCEICHLFLKSSEDAEEHRKSEIHARNLQKYDCTTMLQEVNEFCQKIDIEREKTAQLKQAKKERLKIMEQSEEKSSHKSLRETNHNEKPKKKINIPVFEQTSKFKIAKQKYFHLNQKIHQQGEPNRQISFTMPQEEIPNSITFVYEENEQTKSNNKRRKKRKGDSEQKAESHNKQTKSTKPKGRSKKNSSIVNEPQQNIQNDIFDDDQAKVKNQIEETANGEIISVPLPGNAFEFFSDTADGTSQDQKESSKQQTAIAHTAPTTPLRSSLFEQLPSSKTLTPRIRLKYSINQNEPKMIHGSFSLLSPQHQVDSYIKQSHLMQESLKELSPFQSESLATSEADNFSDSFHNDDNETISIRSDQTNDDNFANPSSLTSNDIPQNEEDENWKSTSTSFFSNADDNENSEKNSRKKGSK